MRNWKWVAVVGLAISLVCTGYLFGQEYNTDGADTPKVTGDEAFDRLSTAELKLQLAMLKTQNDLLTGKKDEGNVANARESADALTDILTNAPTDPKMVRALVGKSLWQFHLAKAGARSAPQISQAADEATVRLELLQVQQNQRIIQLLEQLAHKSSGGK